MATRTTSNQPLVAETTAAADAAVETAKRTAGAIAESNADRSEEISQVLDAVVAGQTVAVQAVETTSRAMLGGMEKVRQEVVDFVSTRIRHDMETQQELLGCRNFDELREVQTRFVRTAMDQYTAESKRLMELGSEVLQRSVNADG